VSAEPVVFVEWRQTPAGVEWRILTEEGDICLKGRCVTSVVDLAREAQRAYGASQAVVVQCVGAWLQAAEWADQALQTQYNAARAARALLR
jgi:hypothetical protein